MRLLTCILILFFAQKSKSQDAVFIQYKNSGMYINPAFLAGIQLKKLGFNYSYDLHRLSIGTTSPQLNAHELSIRYLFDGKKKAKTGIED